ncbi:uncharacterized protein UV8b_06393 [Ustilaginoidea virens]|uniref:PH domain-containing protein n=1 Tax=Ustilaginoidea virens TaxID=1159556 RepID=A0A8E5HVC6_USTVR|nr:uncharacterized protein UV8b_06393 [Ustilaginoidea virens]QUC22152.1 hypothetical protein UV8b_06393 [Ustilaginoidea virens]
MTTPKAVGVTPRKGSSVIAEDGGQVTAASLSRGRPDYGPLVNVNQNGCFESDRVIKSGYLEKRTRTKNWKAVYLVLRPNTLSMYKNEKETKLRHQLYLSDLTAVAFLKDPKQKRHNVFGLFSPSRNFHLQARTKPDAQEWVDLIRKEARIEEEEEEMFLASPKARSVSPREMVSNVTTGSHATGSSDGPYVEGVLSSSPEAYCPPESNFTTSEAGRRKSSMMDSSGMSGTELVSQSDWSDTEPQRPKVAAKRSGSQLSIINAALQSGNGVPVEPDPDRVIWQGWLWLLRSKRGVKQWKDMWAVLRPRNLILYKDESEYTAQWIVELSAVVDVVDTDPVSKSKENCLQVITEEKSYRFCAHDEESIVQFIGAFKSLLAKRRGLEARAAATSS